MSHYFCTECSASGVRLWRPYMNDTPLRCLSCAENHSGRTLQRNCDQLGWLVPAVPDTEEPPNYWGYTSVPQDRVDWWYSLPLTPK